MIKVCILDFGFQYTQLIARKVRELGVYSEILPFDISLRTLQKERPAALILSGGSRSLYDDGTPLPVLAIFYSGIPLLGFCYGLQVMAYLLGGRVVLSAKREYGFARLKIIDRRGLFKGIRDGSKNWMNHGDRVEKLPPGFVLMAKTANTRVAAVESAGTNPVGVQFHFEVIHTRAGRKILANYLFGLAGIQPEWSMKSFGSRKVAEIRQLVGREKVLCRLSRGIDSLVKALLVQCAIGSRLTCVFIDNGLLREGQFEEMMEQFRHKFSLRVVGVNASSFFFKRLRGVDWPESKRKIIGRTFIDMFEKEARKIGGVKLLAQGTIYPNVIESRPGKGPSATIKSHHNVGGLPRSLRFQLIEPLKELFKDEVRALASQLGIDRKFITQHPFPSPGLAVRILGEVTAERAQLIREADRIFLEKVRGDELYHRLWQAFTVFLTIRSVGVMGDERTYEHVVAVRLVQSVDGMTADWYAARSEFLARVSAGIVNEGKGIICVVYDITTKPPATIEWE